MTREAMVTKYLKYASLTKVENKVLRKSTLVFDVEEALLKSSSMFPYFMSVAFEGGGLLRALILLLLYPIILLLGEEMRLKAMVFLCFFGIKAKTFRLGMSSLPKLFLENVGHEGFEIIMKFGKRVAISRLPRIMVEGYLRHYLGIEDIIIGGEIMEFGGYYLGLLNKMSGEELMPMGFLANMENQVVGIGGENTLFKTQPFTYCKDIYMVTRDDKNYWINLPKEKYPKPFIFHDGRLAFEPTPLQTLVMFIWLPFGISLCNTRILIAITLPYKLSTPILAFLGICNILSNHKHTQNPKPEKSNGVVYVCNHKTLLDPAYISLVLQTSLSVVTYSISKSTTIFSRFNRVRTLNLTRDKAKDAVIMHDALTKGDLVVCPEGTTCREPYLLRFSPLFAEITDDIIPVAIEAKFSMFYGTTATGIKALDLFFVLLNPKPCHYLKFLDKLPESRTCKGGGTSRVEVANYVQAEIGKALEYKCTELTRREKYAILAGSDGLVGNSK